jgi:hypothetical protein
MTELALVPGYRRPFPGALRSRVARPPWDAAADGPGSHGRMQPHPALAYTDELLELTGDLRRPAAADFVMRVFDGGAYHGSRTALANAAAELTSKDEQIHRLAQRLEALGEDPLAIARIIAGR